ncbi:MAG: hypothetical protein JWQ87_5461 [Candidatus Sulfotelmatobacter sp.]|nr:hypothetical protein [Candidatus Sulfotelmatobacter sp.]
MPTEITFRKTAESLDRDILYDWIAADPEHSAKGMTPDFFYAPDIFAVALDNGTTPGLYVRLDPETAGTVRLHIQFGTNRRVSAITMVKAWPTFLQTVKAAGKVSRLIFESVSPPLIAFCKRRFGFTQVGTTNDYELLLEN